MRSDSNATLFENVAKTRKHCEWESKSRFASSVCVSVCLSVRRIWFGVENFVLQVEFAENAPIDVDSHVDMPIYERFSR